MTTTSSTQIKTADNTSLSMKTKAQLPSDENELSDDFIVGALLFSLFASNRSEIVNEMLSQDE